MLTWTTRSAVVARRRLAGDGQQLEKERGSALVLVVGSISVLMIFALLALMMAMTAAPLSRKAQDARAATAAAQAGLDDYLSRLVANPTYYATAGTGVDASNPAFTPGGAAVADGAGATFTYELLTTPASTAQDGTIRVRSTGRTGGVSRSLTASLSQSGFLDYVYFSDLEVVDPDLVDVRGTDAFVSGLGWGSGSTSYGPDPAVYAQRCGSYLYAGRHATWVGNNSYSAYTSSAQTPFYTRDGAGGWTASTTYDRTVYFSCTAISFGSGDVITGPLHTNDAIRVSSGGVTFRSPVTETGWADGSVPAPPATGRWYGDGTAPNAGGYKPVYAPVLQMPGSNGDLKTRIRTEGTSAGCTYSGMTRIRFDGNTMKVFSPQTTSTTPGCFNAAAREAEQTVSPVPPLVYVDELASSCPSPSTSIGYPVVGEEAGGATKIIYNCAYGTAFVQGKVEGQVTVASARDIVVTGDLTYASGVAGTDVVGLIPNGYTWVYNPQKADGTRLLSTPVRTVQAGILSLGHSFVVQNYDRGGELGTLTVVGTIAQKHRGIVKNGANGYVKDYRFDTRLANLPPPYFLTPADSPWTVVRVTDG